MPLLSEPKRSKSLIIFYLLVSYIFAAFLWWTFFHVQNIREQYSLKMEKAELQFQIYNLDRSIVQKDSVTKDNAIIEYNRKLNMIIGEALVFFVILFFGSYKIHAGLRRDAEISNQQRNFLLSITHELKSPIAGIKLSLQTLYNRQLERAPQQRLLSNSIKDTERLQNLVENILLAAKLETDKSDMFLSEEINLSDLIEDTVQKFSANFNLSDRIVANINTDVYVHGDAIALVSMITNLLENAIKYSTAAIPIQVSLQYNTNKMAHIVVADQGIGIEDVEKKKIFTKFYRVGNEDTRKTKGTGLGLFIIKQLVELHHGTIEVTDNTPKGTIFTIELPCEYYPEVQIETMEMPKQASIEI